MKYDPEFTKKFLLLIPSIKKLSLIGSDSVKLNRLRYKPDPSNTSICAMSAQPWKNLKVVAGVGTRIKKLRTMNCMALIIPNSCYRDPFMSIWTTKLPNDIVSTVFPAFLTAESINARVSASSYGGMSRVTMFDLP